MRTATAGAFGNIVSVRRMKSLARECENERPGSMRGGEGWGWSERVHYSPLN